MPRINTRVSYHDTSVHTGAIYRAAGWRRCMLLQSPPDERLAWYPVTPKVNNPRFDNPVYVAPISDAGNVPRSLFD
jgi:hypothetical protein